LQTWFDLVGTRGKMNKCNIPHDTSTGLSGTQFLTLLIVLASLIPDVQKIITKYDKQHQQGKATFNERYLHTNKQDED
jgi:hypothetical protein